MGEDRNNANGMASSSVLSRGRGRGVSLALGILALLVSDTAPAQEIVIATQLDTPPYVMQGATRGIEVELVRLILDGQTLRFIQMPYDQLETAVAEKKADLALPVRRIEERVSYSKDFITFANSAISKKSAGVEIGDVDDLEGHPVFAWEGASGELGDEFKALFAARPDNYAEIGDQREQVRAFWSAEAAVIVIDRSVFAYFSHELGHSLDEVAFHPIFPAVTNFRVAFKDPNQRDEFDQGLTKICQSGEYAKVLARYHVELPRTVCEWRRAARAAAEDAS